jgi:hypothetical protein
MPLLCTKYSNMNLYLIFAHPIFVSQCLLHALFHIIFISLFDPVTNHAHKS